MTHLFSSSDIISTGLVLGFPSSYILCPGNRKNMLLDITVSPCSRVTMFFYMLMQITARLLGRTLIHHYTLSGIVLKGLSHEIDFKNIRQKLIELGLNKGCGWFLNFPEAPLIFK
jgi:hypothetical protein